MENQEVISIIKTGLVWGNWTTKQIEAFLIAMEAVKKQVPQRVVKIQGVSNQACSICKSKVNGKYCSNCGKKLRNKHTA